jgi:ABC-2 type transport system ATP-binding protein
MSHIENVQNLKEVVKQTSIDTGVFDFINKPINTLSRGMRQRVGITQAIIHNPKIVLLDEPASGLDPEARIALSQLIIQLKNKGMTLIVSSHILAELEDYCTEMIILKEGNMIEHTQLINHKTGGSTKHIIKLVAEHLSEEVVNSFISTFDNSIKILEKTTTEILFELNEEVTKQHVLLSFLIKQGVAVKEIAAVKRNLQEEYLKTMQEK